MLDLVFNDDIMRVRLNHPPVTSIFDRWYGYDSQSWVVKNDIVLDPTSMVDPTWYIQYDSIDNVSHMVYPL